MYDVKVSRRTDGRGRILHQIIPRASETISIHIIPTASIYYILYIFIYGLQPSGCHLVAICLTTVNFGAKQ